MLKNKIVRWITELHEDQRFETKEVAELFMIDRTNASRYLNELVNEDILIKIKGKPVYFEKAKNEHTNFLRNNPSLVEPYQLAKSAVIYPNKRLHILLVGETGVGKNFFSQLIYEISLKENVIKEENKMLTFNCADYADNPQLAYSYLFGSEKGAFTGADAVRKGIIELTNDGILFLDEVHRLPAEVQEMLFSLMDTGRYARLGESEKHRESNIQIICATTEDVNSNLLNTFIRRIHIKIKIPPLRERKLLEREILINLFFSNEMKNLNTEINVTKNAYRCFLMYNCKGNIGQLESDIKILCARNYINVYNKLQDSILITTRMLSDEMTMGIHLMKPIWTDIHFKNKNYITYNKSSRFENIEDITFYDIYNKVCSKITDISRLGIDTTTQLSLLKNIVLNFYKRINSKNISNEYLKQKVGIEIYMAAKLFLNAMGEENIDIGFTTFLYKMCDINSINTTTYMFDTPLVKSIMIDPKVLENINILRERLNTNFTDFQIKLISIFITQPELDDRNIKILLVCHGNETASSLAEFTNNLYEENLVTPIDIGLQTLTKKLTFKIKSFIEKNKLSEVIILTDMGSASIYANKMESKYENVISFDCISTIHILEVCNMIKSDKNIKTIQKYLINIIK